MANRASLRTDAKRHASGKVRQYSGREMNMGAVAQQAGVRCRSLLAGLAVTLFLAPGCARTDDVITSAGASINIEPVASGLGVPWAMAFVAPDRMLVTERGGRVLSLDIATGDTSEVTGIPAVKTGGQGGLLDVAVPRDYPATGWVYFTYVKDQDGQGVTVVARARLSGGRFTDWQELLVTRSATRTGRHFGSRIAFVGDDDLFFGVGDRGHRPNGEDLSTHAGSILRIHPAGVTRSTLSGPA